MQQFIGLRPGEQQLLCFNYRSLNLPIKNTMDTNVHHRTDFPLRLATEVYENETTTVTVSLHASLNDLNGFATTWTKTRIIHLSVVSALMLLTLLGNVIVIITIVSCAELRKKRVNIFILNLAFFFLFFSNLFSLLFCFSVVVYGKSDWTGENATDKVKRHVNSWHVPVILCSCTLHTEAWRCQYLHAEPGGRWSDGLLRLDAVSYPARRVRPVDSGTGRLQTVRLRLRRFRCGHHFPADRHELGPIPGVVDFLSVALLLILTTHGGKTV